MTNAALSGTLSECVVATSKVFWIGTIGHHWRYGVKEDNGREMTPLIDWHETIHDEAIVRRFSTSGCSYCGHSMVIFFNFSVS